MIKVRSHWPGFAELTRKYVDSSLGQRARTGTYTNEPSENTAEFSAAKKLSPAGTTVPRYCSMRCGWSRTASEKEQKMTPALPSFSLKVVATDTLANTA